MTPRPDPPAVVFDCMILLQALANEESAAAQLLDLVDRAEIALYVSDQTLRELRDVIDRPEVRKSLTGINDLRVKSLFRRLDKKAANIKSVDRVFQFSRDPADEPYINLAIAAQADFLVTRDRDLLDTHDCLRRHKQAISTTIPILESHRTGRTSSRADV